jgi:hypothetical protein
MSPVSRLPETRYGSQSAFIILDLLRIAALNDSHEYGDDRQNQQYMHVNSQRVKSDYTQEPANNKQCRDSP